MACRKHNSRIWTAWTGRRSAVVIGGLAALVALPGAALAASQRCEGGTHLLVPKDGGSIDPSSALVLADSVCAVPRGADPSDPLVMMAVADLSVDVDGQAAALVPMSDVSGGWLWRIEPAPPVGSRVTISGCDGVDLNAGLCYPVLDDLQPDGPLLQWSFTIAEEPEPAPEPTPLVEPVILDLQPSGNTDPFSGEERTLWSFTVERGEADPGTPMLVDVVLNPGSAGAQLPWTSPDIRSDDLEMGAPEGADVCVEARTFDLYGNEGPTAIACADADEGGGCSCRSGGGGLGALAFTLLVFGLRWRPRGSSARAQR